MRFIILTIIILAICNVSAVYGLSQPDQVISSTAMIEHLDIIFTESEPLKVQVVAYGYFPDSCTQIDTIKTKTVDKTFYVTISTIRPEELSCAQMLTPFKEVVNLSGITDLEEGEYTVNVNGITNTFIWNIDQVY